MAGLSGDRDRLAEQMDQSRAEQGMSWEQVAQRGGISIALLRRIRSGGRLTKDSGIAIERGLNWTRGGVQGVLSGDNYAYGFVEPVAGRRPLDPLTSSPEEIVAFLDEVRRYQGEEVYRELLEGTLEVQRLAAERKHNAVTREEHEELRQTRPIE